MQCSVDSLVRSTTKRKVYSIEAIWAPDKSKKPSSTRVSLSNPVDDVRDQQEHRREEEGDDIPDSPHKQVTNGGDDL